MLQQSLPVYLGCGVTESLGFVPSESTPADDPSRRVPIRSPAKAPLPWMTDSKFESEDCLSALDEWLGSYGVTPWDLSGLPDLSELDGPVADDLTWTRKHRFAEFRSLKVSKQSAHHSQNEPFAPGIVIEELSNVSILPVESESATGSAKTVPASVFDFPTASSLGIDRL